MKYEFMRHKIFFCLLGLLVYVQNINPQEFSVEEIENISREENESSKEDKKTLESNSDKKESNGDIETKISIKAKRTKDFFRDYDEVPFSGDFNFESAMTAGVNDKIKYKIGFIAEGGLFNNADLRKLNETDNLTVENTDDKITTAISRFFVSAYFRVTKRLDFKIDLYKNGYWGSDQLSGSSSNNSFLTSGSDPFLFAELYTRAFLINKTDSTLSMKIGRQFFEIGSLTRDYVLRDYLDAVTFQYYNKNIGGLKVLAVDFYKMGSSVSDTLNYTRYFSSDDKKVDFFDADVNSLRTGAVYESKDLTAWGQNKTGPYKLQTKLYGFYARYGALSGTGADITEEGNYGNYADNDYAAVFGNRWIFNGENILFFIEGAVSTGLDRKMNSADGKNIDITADGYALNGGLVFFSNFGMSISLDAFYASGPVYDEYGREENRGFVSFKGNHIGGLLFSKFLGAHPSDITEVDGFGKDSFGYERKSGTLAARLSCVFDFKQVYFGLDMWYFQDTGKSAVEDAPTNSQKAQERFGKALGVETDLFFEFTFENHLSLYAAGGIFAPSYFYKGEALSPNDPMGRTNFWGFLIGSRLIF
ncbi:MAG: hypothetical protein OEZ13_01000 [Spirochaetia bacterium]|nr:hypothetical protein [Spirochaetia bacterium]